MGRTRTQRLLLEEQEHGVQELEVFGQVVQLMRHVSAQEQHNLDWVRPTYVVQDDERLGPASIMIANGKEDALAHNGGQNLFDEQSQEDGRYRRQEKVVDQK